MANNTVLDVKDLKVYFPINRGFIFVKNKGNKVESLSQIGKFLL